MATSKFKNVHTMIGPDAKIKGPVNLEQGIIIYGEVYGDITTRGSIRIAKNGTVKGNVKGSNIILGGTIIGHINIVFGTRLRNLRIMFLNNCVISAVRFPCLVPLRKRDVVMSGIHCKFYSSCARLLS